MYATSSNNVLMNALEIPVSVFFVTQGIKRVQTFKAALYQNMYSASKKRIVLEYLLHLENNINKS